MKDIAMMVAIAKRFGGAGGGENPIDTVTPEEVQGVVNDALQAAKESGEFNGPPGTPGAPGYTPIKGVDYFDGQPGEPGAPGKDGVSPTVTVNKSGKVTTVMITDKDGAKTATINDGADGYTPVKGKDYFDGEPGDPGYTPQKGVDYFDGQPGAPGSPGKDGVSATHSWNGTTLTITSASGTSSADLKGGKGDPGVAGTSVESVTQTTTSTADNGVNVVTVKLSNGATSSFEVRNGSKGDPGNPGAPGYTPVKGTDYYTAADKAEMVNAVIAALPTWTGGSY